MAARYFISSALLYIIFSGIAPVCYCCICCNENSELKTSAEWILKWRQPIYGLEFQNGSETLGYREDLNNRDKLSIIEDTGSKSERIRKEIKGKIDTYIEEQRKQDKPEFEITRMDPIEYDYKGKTMWLILKNITFENLGSYDHESAFYLQSPRVETGYHRIPKKKFETLIKQESLPKEKYLPYDKKTDENVIYKRRDVSWKINIGAFFLNGERPVKIKARFSIQPKLGEGEGLRKSGTVEFELGKFFFDINFGVKHIDDDLRRFLDEKIRAGNRVPDFDVEYGFEKNGIKIKKVEVKTKYDGDVKEWGIPEQPADVNPQSDQDNVSKEKSTELSDENPQNDQREISLKGEIAEDKEKEQSAASVTEVTEHSEDKEKEQSAAEDKEKEQSAASVKEVTEHFEKVRDLILTDQDTIRQKLCVNVMPKITWKIMKMETKMQLNSLLYDVVKYDNNFNARSVLPPANPNYWGIMTAISRDFLKKCFGLGRTNSGGERESNRQNLKDSFDLNDNKKN